jgi:hypothetical protein
MEYFTDLYSYGLKEIDRETALQIATRNCTSCPHSVGGTNSTKPAAKKLSEVCLSLSAITEQFTRTAAGPKGP